MFQFFNTWICRGRTGEGKGLAGRKQWSVVNEEEKITAAIFFTDH
jgi:hypothetical protein